jgi:hypothetical protein
MDIASCYTNLDGVRDVWFSECAARKFLCAFLNPAIPPLRLRVTNTMHLNKLPIYAAIREGDFVKFDQAESTHYGEKLDTEKFGRAYCSTTSSSQTLGDSQWDGS